MATGSYDPQGKSLSYQWRIVSKPFGSQIALEQTKTSPVVTPDLTGNYTFSLEVDNGEVKSAPSLVSIFAGENRPPLALTSRNSYRGPVNTALEISGSRSYDPDYDPLGYSWEIINRPDGSMAEISQNDLKTVSFTPDVAGRYDINLIVNDGDLSSTPRNVSVTATALTETYRRGNLVRYSSLPESNPF